MKEFIKKHKNVIIMTAICLTYLALNSQDVFAASPNPANAITQLEKGAGGVVKSDVSLKFSNMYQDFYGLISMVVLAILSIKTTISSIAFSQAGEDVKGKAELKRKILYNCLGLAFFASSAGIVKFALANLNMF